LAGGKQHDNKTVQTDGRKLRKKGRKDEGGYAKGGVWGSGRVRRAASSVVFLLSLPSRCLSFFLFCFLLEAIIKFFCPITAFAGLFFFFFSLIAGPKLECISLNALFLDTVPLSGVIGVGQRERSCWVSPTGIYGGMRATC
jgi:hypothetical protein